MALPERSTLPLWYSSNYPKIYKALVSLVPRYPPNLHLLPIYATNFTMFEAGELFPDFSYLMFCYFLNLFHIDQCVFMVFVGAFFFFLEGRHFNAVYGKDLVDSLVINSDRLMSELEKKPYDHLARTPPRPSRARSVCFVHIRLAWTTESILPWPERPRRLMKGSMRGDFNSFVIFPFSRSLYS